MRPADQWDHRESQMVVETTGRFTGLLGTRSDAYGHKSMWVIAEHTAIAGASYGHQLEPLEDAALALRWQTVAARRAETYVLCRCCRGQCSGGQRTHRETHVVSEAADRLDRL